MEIEPLDPPKESPDEIETLPELANLWASFDAIFTSPLTVPPDPETSTTDPPMAVDAPPANSTEPPADWLPSPVTPPAVM